VERFGESRHNGGQARASPQQRGGKESMRTLTRSRHQHLRIATMSLVVALACLMAILPHVLGASPHRLAGPVTDDVGALSGNATQIQTVLNGLQDATGAQLWVWYTDTLGGQDSGEFATETAKASGLGPTDLLLVIALDDRAYGYWKGDDVRISDANLGQILSQDMEPGLRSKDYAGAVVATAKALTDAMSGGAVNPVGTPIAENSSFPSLPGGGSSDGSAGGSLVGTILALAIVAAGAALIGWWLLSGRRRGDAGRPIAGPPGGPNSDLPAMPPKELDELANRILVETDDAIRDSDQELGFAQAQFGDDAAAPFLAAIAAARDDLKGAFTIRQRLDDATPEDAASRRQMLVDLVVACRKAQERLNGETRRFDELRALETEAPDILAKLPAKADALEARLPASGATLAGLGAYADADWQAVAANIDQARTRIAAVRAATAEGVKALAAGTPGAAAHAARLAEDGLAQGTAFLDAVDRLAAELTEARKQVDAEIAAAVADLARAKAAATAGPPDADVARRLADAEQLLSEARTAVDPPKPDVTGAYDKARRADELADAIEAGIRSAREQQARDIARLQAGLSAAQTAVTRASDYVAGHRGGIGTDARTRIAEATRHLQQAVAMSQSDPTGALNEADAATRLASEAEQIAEQDYGRWDDPFQGGRGGRAGSDVAGAIIGGIIGGLISGGGRRGGPFGGGGFGGFGGGGGGFGGFGGSSGGGSFGGGGGSSGGGRW
jgi:uncharacterized membrane protein YgcG